MSNLKNLHAYILFVAVLIVSAVYIVGSKYQTTPVVNTTPDSMVKKTQELKDLINVPEGWKVYQNEPIFGILFAFPGDWEFTENIRSKNSGTLTLKGDGYTISIRNWGSGVPDTEWTHPPYYIGGYKMETWWYSVDEGEHVLVLSTKGTTIQRQIVIFVTTPTLSIEMVDKILSTIVFLK